MNVIVPTDFTTVSVNAAHFAARMLANQTEATLVLYHVYANESDTDFVRAKLQKLKDLLLEESMVKVECQYEVYHDFLESLEKRIRHLNASLVIMAIHERTRLEQAFDTSHSIRLMQRSLCPVLVIPKSVTYREIRNVALASDFQDVEQAIPIVPVRKVLNLFKPRLHIVNINSEIYISLNESYQRQQAVLAQMFEDYNPEFYFITTYDFSQTLHQFIHDKNIDLVLAFPRRHSFINNIFKGSHTKKLVLESDIPVLTAHE